MPERQHSTFLLWAKHVSKHFIIPQLLHLLHNSSIDAIQKKIVLEQAWHFFVPEYIVRQFGRNMSKINIWHRSNMYFITAREETSEKALRRFSVSSFKSSFFREAQNLWIIVTVALIEWSLENGSLCLWIVTRTSLAYQVFCFHPECTYNCSWVPERWRLGHRHNPTYAERTLEIISIVIFFFAGC